MKNNETKKVNFDLSELSLQDLVTVYTNIKEFKTSVKDKKIDEKKENK